jgi:three-Cys-motif partner protein
LKNFANSSPASSPSFLDRCNYTPALDITQTDFHNQAKIHRPRGLDCHVQGCTPTNGKKQCGIRELLTLTRKRIKSETNTGMRVAPQFDRIGYWSEIKLEIIKSYAAQYSKILAAQNKPSLYHVYIDAFAGSGVHLTKATQDFIPGSPLNALNVRPPFREYHLIDIKPEKVESLKGLIGSRRDVFVYQGDCNRILLEKVFPRVKFEDYRRGLCILDPYGLQLDWKVIHAAGQSKSFDIFLNFPIADINRNVLWRNPEGVENPQKARMNAYWGDDSWRDIAYRSDTTLFGEPEKQSNEIVAETFRERLNKVAGFARVPRPLPMRNSKGAIVYYLFFASQKNTAEDIVMYIFQKYSKRGER